MADVIRTADERSLPPWKAFIGLLFCAVIALLAFNRQDWGIACWISGCAGMFLQDWVYRLRDRYDPTREIGND